MGIKIVGWCINVSVRGEVGKFGFFFLEIVRCVGIIVFEF